MSCAETAPTYSGDTSGASRMAKKISMIKLYTVHNGGTDTQIVKPENSGRPWTCTVDGYVTGIVVLAKEELEVSLDGQRLTMIRKNQNGTYSIQNTGGIGADEFETLSTSISSEMKTLSEQHPEEQTLLRSSLKGYSYFPRVIGDTVTPRSDFLVTLESEKQMLALAVRQQGYQPLSIAQRPAEIPGAIEFEYLGERLDSFESIGDIEAKLRAVTEGIIAVEQTFKINLVRRVNILDYEGIHNAITCEGKDDIWFYINTLKQEPVSELKSMAEHEALHILVNRAGMASNYDLRELFADLKGYDVFSLNRFMLVTRGITSSKNDSESSEALFFAFIDEKNFLAGMKGGHSSHNLQELCTSFLHSLMYIDRLKPNLSQLRALRDGQGRMRVLTAEEKVNIFNTYMKMLEALMVGVSDSDEDVMCRTHCFLNTCLKKIQNSQHCTVPPVFVTTAASKS